MAELLLDFLNKEEPPVTYLIGRGILPVAGKCIMAGHPKTNKSFLVINMGLDLALGRPLFEAFYPNKKPVFPVYKRNKVLFLEQELGSLGVQERMKSIIGAEGIDPVGLDFYVKTKDMSMRIDTEDGKNAIQAELAQVKPDVVIFDPLSKFHLADENSAQHMGAIMRRVDRWIQDFGCAVIIIHHQALASLNPEMHRKGGAKLRGSSAIFADVDTSIDVIRKSNANQQEPVLQLEFELRRGEPLEPIFLRRLKTGNVQYLGDRSKKEEVAEEKIAPPTSKKGMYDDL